MPSIKIFPSLISGDLLNLETCIKSLEPESDGFHIDVMDFHFVPNLTWGPMFVNAIARITEKPLFVHLMIENSLQFIDTLDLRPHDTLSFHIEEPEDIKEEINYIKEKNIKTNIAISPKTAIEKLYPYLGSVDQVLLMSVNPGFSGQQFLDNSVDRLDTLVHHRTQENLSFEIVMDGGINETNIGELAKRGVDAVGVASAIFAHPDPVKALQELRRSAEK